MVVYRDLVSDELVHILGDESWGEYHCGSGKNTFNYDKDKDYKHFFMFADHASFYRPLINAAVIGVYDLSEDLINQRGFGFYGHITTPINNELYSEKIPIPEILIEEKDFKKEQLICFKSEFKKNDTNIFSETSNVFEKMYEAGNYRYSPADIYYEIVYRLGLRHDMDFKNVAKVLENKDIMQEIEEFFKVNYDYFDEAAKKIVKR